MVEVPHQPVPFVPERPLGAMVVADLEATDFLKEARPILFLVEGQEAMAVALIPAPEIVEASMETNSSLNRDPSSHPTQLGNLSELVPDPHLSTGHPRLDQDPLTSGPPWVVSLMNVTIVNLEHCLFPEMEN